MDLAEYEETRPRGRRRKANPWWQPSPEDYYSPFDEHFDLSDCSDGSDSEDEDFDSLETKGAFGVMSTELLFRLSSYLDLQSLCRVSSLSRSLKRIFDSPQLWGARIHSQLSIPPSQLTDVSDMKHWFLYQTCIAPHRRKIKSMTLEDKLELEFEERLLYHKISYNSWALPLRMLHSPLQDNVTVMLIILQSILIFAKLEGALNVWPWVAIFAPVWIFDFLYFCSCVIWFYFLAKSLISPDYAEVCMSGWLKCVLEAVQIRRTYFDYLLFVSSSTMMFLVFPALLTLQLDVFSGLYKMNDASALLSSHMSWTAVFSPLILSSVIILHLLQKRVVFLRRNRRYYRLGFAFFIGMVTFCAGMFFTFLGLHLDKLLPEWWNLWHTVSPIWVIAGVGMVMIAGGFDLSQRTHLWRRLQTTPYSMTRAPLIGLMVVFIIVLVRQVEERLNGGVPADSIFFPFSFLFGLESVLVLYWVQDLVDFDGHKQYAMRKQFNFSLRHQTPQQTPPEEDEIPQL